jgi:hypothetical protein
MRLRNIICNRKDVQMISKSNTLYDCTTLNSGSVSHGHGISVQETETSVHTTDTVNRKYSTRSLFIAGPSTDHSRLHIYINEVREALTERHQRLGNHGTAGDICSRRSRIPIEHHDHFLPDQRVGQISNPQSVYVWNRPLARIESAPDSSPVTRESVHVRAGVCRTDWSTPDAEPDGRCAGCGGSPRMNGGDLARATHDVLRREGDAFRQYGYHLEPSGQPSMASGSMEASRFCHLASTRS